MGLFEYIMVLTSILLGLGVAELFGIENIGRRSGYHEI